MELISVEPGIKWLLQQCLAWILAIKIYKWPCGRVLNLSISHCFHHIQWSVLFLRDVPSGCVAALSPCSRHISWRECFKSCQRWAFLIFSLFLSADLSIATSQRESLENSLARKNITTFSVEIVRCSLKYTGLKQAGLNILQILCTSTHSGKCWCSHSGG